MTILLAAFAFITLMCFGIVAFFMRPTQEQKAMQRRVVGITPHVDFSQASASLDEYLSDTSTGSFGWLEHLVKNSNLSQALQRLILQSDSTTTVGTVIMSSLGFAFVAALIAFLCTHLALVAAIAAAVAGAAPVIVLKIRRSRRLAAFDAALPDSIDMISRSLRAGHSLNAALGIVADQAIEPCKSEFDEVFKKQNYGLPLRDALMQMLDRVPSQDLRVMITAVLVQKDTGGNLVEILDRTVAVIRDRIRIQGEIRTHTAQGRLTGWILCLLPVVMLVLINIINPGYSKVLTDDPTGRKLLYAGIVLLCIGGFIIRQIINGIEV